MADERYEFRVCQVQEARVTFVSGQWAGKMALSLDHEQEALKSCPEQWDYLNEAGAEGWDLVGVLGQIGGEFNMQCLYLRREKA